MKTIVNYILEKLKLNPNSKLDSNSMIREKIISNFKKCPAFDEKNNKFFEKVNIWLNEKIDKNNLTISKLNNFLDDGPEPLDDYEIDFDYYLNNVGYFEFISDKNILGFSFKSKSYTEYDGYDGFYYFYLR